MLVGNNAAPALGLESLGRGLDQRVRRSTERHNNNVSVHFEGFALDGDGSCSSRSVRLAELHLLTFVGADTAVSVVADFDR